MAENEGGGASRSTEPATGTSAATDVSLREHLAQMLASSERRSEQRLHDLRVADLRFSEERDRRYAEVALEREKALKIKETADLAALDLAREIQTYKDEKANDLRSQIEGERGSYVTRTEYLQAHSSLIDKLEATTKPLTDYVAAQQGRSQGIGSSASFIQNLLLVAVAIAGLYLALHR